MINPPALALRRRADELRDAAERQFEDDPDTAALLLFYAAECGLKSIYMIQNNLKNTGETRGSARSARSFVHEIVVLADALRVPRSAYGPHPTLVVTRSGLTIEVSSLHQAWRYGERVNNTPLIYQWLLRIVEWVKRNR